MSTPDPTPTFDLEAEFGPIAAREFAAAPEWAKSELLEWMTGLRSMADADFLIETRSAIYDSANMGRFRGNFEHVHCKATVCYQESRRRLVRDRHDKDCRGPSIYSLAHAQLMRSHHYTPTPDGECHCKVGDDNVH